MVRNTLKTISLQFSYISLYLQVKKKRFNKKSGVTFQLVHRSQQDPLVTDETAPQHVLVPISNKNDATTDAPASKNTRLDPDKRKQEQQKYGIYFDDEYDYLQHLRGDDSQQELQWKPIEYSSNKKELTSKQKINLPSSVFASEVEEDEGMLRKMQEIKGPRPDWDPDIVAALDDDFDYDDPSNQLEDNFMELALNGETEDDDDDEYEDYDDEEYEGSDVGSDDLGHGSENEDRLGPFPKFSMHEDNKSRFTEYSMTSSVIRRNEQLTLLDDKFEKWVWLDFVSWSICNLKGTIRGVVTPITEYQENWYWRDYLSGGPVNHPVFVKGWSI